MSYTISIIKDKFSNNEEVIYLNTLTNDININILVNLIKRFDDLEQQINQGLEEA